MAYKAKAQKGQSSVSGAYILLGSENKALQECIHHKLEAEKKEPCDAKLYDFDQVYYRVLIDPNDRSKMVLSLESPNWRDIRSQGSEDWIKEKLGEYVTNTSDDGVTFEVDLNDEKNKEKAEDIGVQFSKLRVYTLGGPLYRYCKALESGKPLTNTFDFKLRPDTHMWIVPGKDRITCVFAMEFPVKSDRILGNQVLQEFVEVRRMRDLQNTPVISFNTRDAPAELKGCKMPAFDKEAFLGYFSVLILASHIKEGKLQNAVEQVIGFRAYLTYHIKCAKAYFHQRMRARVKSSLQILNRARYEPEDERKKKKIIVGSK